MIIIYGIYFSLFSIYIPVFIEMTFEFINSQGATSGLAAADGHDVQIATAGTSIFYAGSIMHHDTDQTGQTSAPVFPNGTAHY